MDWVIFSSFVDWVSFSSFVDWVSFSSFVDFGSSIYCEKQSGLITVNHGYNECLELLHGQNYRGMCFCLLTAKKRKRDKAEVKNLHHDHVITSRDPFSSTECKWTTVTLAYASGSLSLGRETTCLAEAYHVGECESWTMGANTQYTKRRDDSLTPPKPGDSWSSYPRVGAKRSSVALGPCLSQRQLDCGNKKIHRGRRAGT